MVRLADWRHATPRRLTVRDAIRFELETQQPRLHAKGVVVDVDLADDVGATPCTDSMLTAIETVLGLAVDRSPKRGELQIIGCATGRGLEIEIADAGDESGYPRLNAFNYRDCCQLISAPPNRPGVSYYGAQCPQGGMAWTIVIKPQQALARAA
jgi:hypothetical protein